MTLENAMDLELMVAAGDDADAAVGKPSLAQMSPPQATIPQASEPKAAPKLTLGVYPSPAVRPTQQGPRGIRFDYNLGCRVSLPEGNWEIRLRDLDTGNVLYETRASAVVVNSRKRYYLRCAIEVAIEGKPVFEHQYSAKGQNVLIQFPIGTLGDVIAWFPYAVRFGEVHGCQLTCAMSALIIPLFEKAYPHISFVSHENIQADSYYATYCMGLFFDDQDATWQPCDFRHVGLHKTAAYILGVDPAEQAPLLALPDESRPIAEPYVCIASQSSSQAKYWNNPTGWREVIAFLKQSGYRVICIDQRPVHGNGLVWNHIPHGAEDETGDRPLTERARWLRHAAAYVGLSSGLSWLAWAAGTPVVMISGFTHPTNEFATPFRVINYHVCNSCWNDTRERFDHKDFLWCPRHAGTSRQLECTRLITADQVKSAIARIPGLIASGPIPDPSEAQRGAASAAYLQEQYLTTA
jgi:autotransporter strand-loop-strand O-heptosyltransferase